MGSKSRNARKRRGNERERQASKMEFTDIIRFIATKPLSLTGFNCTNNFKLDDDTYAELKIVEMSPETSINIYESRIRLQWLGQQNTTILLERPIAVMDEVKYELRVKLLITDPGDSIRSASQEEETCLKNDARVRYWKGGMITSLYFSEKIIVTKFSLDQTIAIMVLIIMLLLCEIFDNGLARFFGQLIEKYKNFKSVL